MQITYKSALGIQRSVTYTIYVDPVPSPIHKTGNYFPPDASLASLAQWQSNMVTYGREVLHAEQKRGVTQMYTVGYYDGTRIYYQIADLTGDSSFNACADLVYGSYSKYVNDNKGRYPWIQCVSARNCHAVSAHWGFGSSTNPDHPKKQWRVLNWPDTANIIDWSRREKYLMESKPTW